LDMKNKGDREIALFCDLNFTPQSLQHLWAVNNYPGNKEE